MTMRKTHLFAAALSVAAALAAGHKASADLILNGDFSLGNVDFTSGYTMDSSNGAGETAGANAGAGYYGIVTDSQAWHPLFADFHDHTTGTGNMMIVNGSPAPDTTVWSESDIAVTPGVTYTLSFWATAAYPVSPATLDVTASVNALDQTFTLSSNAGVWQQFTMNFVALTTPTTISIVDTNLDLSGNDFALDDISLNPVANGPTVPLPASALSGSVLLAGVAIANRLRRRRMV
jgi:hypothetical protein